jgi:hypothetical protein
LQLFFIVNALLRISKPLKKHRERSLQKLNREQLVGTTEDAGETTARYEFAD